VSLTFTNYRPLLLWLLTYFSKLLFSVFCLHTFSLATVNVASDEGTVLIYYRLNAVMAILEFLVFVERFVAN